jgi:hypothetical protein
MDKKYGAPWQVAVGEGMFLENFYCSFVNMFKTLIFIVVHTYYNNTIRVWIRHHTYNNKHDLYILSESWRSYVQSVIMRGRG